MIDPKLQDELRARFNPDGSQLRRHQLRMLEMLKYIDKICQENDIPYWLSSGTCLGAVRHGGFIPWDDDVDIEMLGTDYDRLIKILEKNGAGEYLLQTHKTDPAYLLQFGKLRDRASKLKETIIIDRDYRYCGAYIDIFPMEVSTQRAIAVFGEYLLRGCLATNRIENRTLRKTCRTSCYFIAFKLIAPVVRRITNHQQSDCLRHRFGSVFHKPRSLQTIFPLRRIAFEDCLLCVPHDTDHYLKAIFGDYKKLPAIDKIHTHLSNILFIK